MPGILPAKEKKLKPTRAGHELKTPRILKNPEKKKLQKLFFFCERCGRPYNDVHNLPSKCDTCGACLLCEN